MPITQTLFATISLLFLSMNPATAEKVYIGDQQNTYQNINRPEKGTHVNTVLGQYGNPIQKHDAVGIPPISKWVYKDYTVYFEYEHVIHTVMHHQQHSRK